MTASRLLKYLAFLSISATAWAVLQWHETGHAPSPLAARLSFGAFLAALTVALIGQETRPRAMLRFLAAVCALAAVLVFVTDMTREGDGFTSLSGHLAQFAPSALSSLKTATVQMLGAAAWDPLLTSLLAMPTFLAFALLAGVLGFASRPRHEVTIFVN